MKYREVYEGRPEYVDHSSYGQTCADTLVDNSAGTGNTTSAFVLGLAFGSLHQQGVDVDSSTYRSRAATLGNSARARLEANTSRFGAESWAVSGGIGVGGGLNSYYKEDSGADTWAETANTYMPLNAANGANNSYEYGHDGWYAWGHYAASESRGSDSLTKYQKIIDLLLATDATSPPVEYFFKCATDGSASSSWQTDPYSEAAGLNPSTLYTFRVKARDRAVDQNETGWSSSESATTPAQPTEVELIGSWTTGLSHPAESVSNRALIFTAHHQDNQTSGVPHILQRELRQTARRSGVRTRSITPSGYHPGLERDRGIRRRSMLYLKSGIDEGM